MASDASILSGEKKLRAPRETNSSRDLLSASALVLDLRLFLSMLPSTRARPYLRSLSEAQVS